MGDACLDEPSQVPHGETSSRRPWTALRRVRGALTSAELGLYVAVAALSVLVTAVALRLWQADLGVPFFYRGDAVAVLSHFKTVQETGWYEFQSRLGAPAGQMYHDFPTADNLHFLVAKLLLLVVHHVGTAANLYYLAGFPLAALAAAWFFRVCGVSRPLSLVLAVLYSVAPYHFFRNESHLWLASYYPVPLALVVILWVIRGERLWTPRVSLGRPWRWLTGRGAATAAILVLLATASTYYSAFGLVLLATAAVVALTRSGDWRRLGGAVAAGVVLVVTMVANMAPDNLFENAHGLNTEALSRSPSGVEVYALKLTSLILPVNGHRIAAWSDFRAKYDTVYPNPSELHSLGTVAAVGFVLLLVVAVVGIASRRGRAAGHGPASTLVDLAALNLIAFLCATMGGFATLMSMVTSNLRAWNRISIIIAALSLAALGLVLDIGLRRLRRVQLVRRARLAGRRPFWFVAVALSGCVLAVGLWDQLGMYAVPEHASNAALYDADTRWYGALEDTLPAGSMVFQLPYIAFPEGGEINEVGDTVQMRPFLHTSTLRWSSGGIKGRATSDWPRLAAAKEPAEMVGDLAAAGFAGILVDRKALGTFDVEAKLQAELGQPDLVHPDGRFAYYDLGPQRRAIEATNDRATIAEVARQTVTPTMAYPDQEVDVTTGPDGKLAWTAFSPSSRLVLDNPRDQDARVVVTFNLSMARVLPVPGEREEPSLTTDVRVTYGSRDWIIALHDGATPVRITVAAPPGRSSLGIAAGPASVHLPAKERRVAVTDMVVERVHRQHLAH